MLQSAIYEWTHGSKGLLLAYANVALPMLAVQFRARSPIGNWLRSVVMAVPLTLIGGIIMGVMGFLLGRVGVTDGSPVLWIVGVSLMTILGYRFGLRMAYGSDSGSEYRRGAVVSDVKILRDRQRPRGATGRSLPIRTGATSAIFMMRSGAM